MNLLEETKQLCSLYHIKPVHARGQNFLIKPEIYEKIIATAELTKQDTVLEVGPGLGWLTFLLAEQAKSVTAVEVDQKLAQILKLRLEMKEIKNVKLINANILDWPKLKQLPANFAAGGYKVVANLPYNITSIFLRKFLESDPQPKTLTLMLQKEVAQRLAAKPGDLSLLGLSVQFYAEPKLIMTVDKKDFWPSPEVQSALIQLTVKDRPPLNKDEAKLFWRLLKFGFSAKRKMLKNNLAAALKIESSLAENYLAKAGLPSASRPQDLSLEAWLKLLGFIREIML